MQGISYRSVERYSSFPLTDKKIMVSSYNIPQDCVDLLLLATVGNFVASPDDPNLSPQSSMRSMPSVVIDT